MGISICTFLFNKASEEFIYWIMFRYKYQLATTKKLWASNIKLLRGEKANAHPRTHAMSLKTSSTLPMSFGKSWYIVHIQTLLPVTSKRQGIQIHRFCKSKSASASALVGAKATQESPCEEVVQRRRYSTMCNVHMKCMYVHMYIYIYMDDVHMHIYTYIYIYGYWVVSGPHGTAFINCTCMFEGSYIYVPSTHIYQRHS